MAKNDAEKLAILWERSEKAGRDLDSIHDDLQDIKVELAKLPEGLKEAFREECVTRREFKAVGAAFGIVMALFSAALNYLNKP